MTAPYFIVHNAEFMKNEKKYGYLETLRVNNAQFTDFKLYQQVKHN